LLFNSLTFIAFFSLVLAVHYSSISWGAKKNCLLVASYSFYAAWNPPFVVLLWISTLVDWHIARWLFAETNQNRRRLLLLGSLATNLGILGYFKYGSFLLENWQVFMGMFGIDYAVPEWSIILPTSDEQNLPGRFVILHSS
jgi:alginate O-acetyltransferase complex protein AlgI